MAKGGMSQLPIDPLIWAQATNATQKKRYADVPEYRPQNNWIYGAGALLIGGAVSLAWALAVMWWYS